MTCPATLIRAALLLAALLALPGCTPRPAAGAAAFAAALLDLAALADDELGLDLPDRGVSHQRFDEIIERARAALGSSRGRHRLERLTRLLYGEAGFRREVDDRSLGPGLLPWVMAQRRGSCLGLGSLLLALGEPLGLTLEGVLVPGHFFVRYRGPDGARGVELLREGREMPESWYWQRYPMPATHALYLRGLSARETLAVLRFNIANAFRDRGRLSRARDEYQEVVKVLPDFAEAQANLGLACHRLRDYPCAEAAYRLAAQAHPGLAGLRDNLDVLRRQWQAIRHDVR